MRRRRQAGPCQFHHFKYNGTKCQRLLTLQTTTKESAGAFREFHRNDCAGEVDFAGEATGDVMKWITPGTSLALVVGVAAADAQGVGYAPGVNPSNPQDLTY